MDNLLFGAFCKGFYLNNTTELRIKNLSNEVDILLLFAEEYVKKLADPDYSINTLFSFMYVQGVVLAEFLSRHGRFPKNNEEFENSY